MTLKEYRKKLLELELKPITNSEDLKKFNNDRNKALPSIELKNLLISLSKNEKNKVAIISGRPH